MSRYVLDAQPYNTERTDVTWETCTLRGWLNEDFYNSAFSPEEQARINLTYLANPDNPQYGTYGGNITVDRVFCLSLEDIRKYYEFNHYDEAGGLGYCEYLLAEPTEYAVSRGCYTKELTRSASGHVSV